MANKKDIKREKIYISKSHPKFGYAAGKTYDGVPEDIARQLKNEGYAKEPTAVLPTDIPGRDALISAEVDTIEKVKALGKKELVDIKDIGEATAENILAYFGE